MKFDFLIGNPPYQDSTSVNNRDSAVYQYFYDSAEEISRKYILISPARFLFNTGLTPKDWNEKMLADAHLKVKYYTQNSAKVFSNTDIKGGVVVLYRDAGKEFGAIEEFIPDDMLRGIARHFKKNAKINFPSIMYGGRSDLKFNDLFIEENPESIELRLKAIQKKHPKVKELSPNEEYEIKSSTLEILAPFFKENEPEMTMDYYKILGLLNGKRVYRWIERKYLTARYPERNNIDAYKVMVPESNGSGAFGEVLSTPVVLEPYESSTPTFISVGCFKTRVEAENALKYVKTKMLRTLLGILKKTQHNASTNWAYIPLQDFTSNSDIDWSGSVAEIDQQLYRKYGLSDDEITFIETKVKEMI